MPMAIPIIMVAAAAVAAYGAHQQGQAAKKAGDFNAKVSLQNAEAARSQASMRASQQERETMLRMGAIRAAHGASGGTADGSVLDVLADTAAQGEMQRQNLVYQGEMAARGYQNTAQLDIFGGQAEQKAGNLKAGSELLGGVAGAMGARSKLKGPSSPPPTPSPY